MDKNKSMDKKSPTPFVLLTMRENRQLKQRFISHEKLTVKEQRTEMIGGRFLGTRGWGALCREGLIAREASELQNSPLKRFQSILNHRSLKILNWLINMTKCKTIKSKSADDMIKCLWVGIQR